VVISGVGIPEIFSVASIEGEPHNGVQPAKIKNIINKGVKTIDNLDETAMYFMKIDYTIREFIDLTSSVELKYRRPNILLNY